MLALLPDLAARRREIYRLHEWLLTQELSCLITLKASEEPHANAHPSHGFMQFMVDCSVLLNHSVVLGVSQRNLRVQKYRGSSFDENESPFVIGKSGFDVAILRLLGRGADAPGQRNRVTLDAEQADLIANQVEKTLSARAVASRKAATRMRALRGAGPRHK